VKNGERKRAVNNIIEEQIAFRFQDIETIGMYVLLILETGQTFSDLYEFS